MSATQSQNAGMRTGGAVLSRLGVFAGLLLLITLVVCLHIFCSLMKEQLELHLDPLYRQWGDLVLVGVIVIYALLLTVPFVPSVELGWALMMWFGVEGTVTVYMATIFALALSFGIGRLVPFRWVARLLRGLHLHGAEQLALRLADARPGERLRIMAERASSPSIPLLLRYRYVLLGILFNVPGNSMIGGGGGIGMLAGLSGIYSFTGYLLLVAIAVLPVPVIFLVNHWLLMP